MGVTEGQGSVARLVLFLDENHCRNPHLLDTLRGAGIAHEAFLDHFPGGLADVCWIPVIAERGWALLTSDANIRHNHLERRAVEESRLRMFYFSRNQISGAEMGKALARALPRMLAVFREEPPPFTASITRAGEVALRDRFGR